jgi:hypothetical protein
MELGLNKSLRVYREGKVDHIRRMNCDRGFRVFSLKFNTSSDVLLLVSTRTSVQD